MKLNLRLLLAIGMALVWIAGVVAATQQYTCSMHPGIVSDKPGNCPICGMPLQPVRADTSAGSGAPTAPGPIRVDAETVQRAITELPVEFREIVVLREMEGFSYKEIADLSDVPIGTVMSRLARARKQLQTLLASEFQTGGSK